MDGHDDDYEYDDDDEKEEDELVMTIPRSVHTALFSLQYHSQTLS